MLLCVRYICESDSNHRIRTGCAGGSGSARRTGTYNCRRNARKSKPAMYAQEDFYMACITWPAAHAQPEMAGIFFSYLVSLRTKAFADQDIDSSHKILGVKFTVPTNYGICVSIMQQCIVREHRVQNVYKQKGMLFV